jgi:hypothetical protein
VIFRSAHVRNLILGFAMSKWRLLRLLIMSLRQMTFISTIRCCTPTASTSPSRSASRPTA